jgi:anti-anti-sigma factor
MENNVVDENITVQEIGSMKVIAPKMSLTCQNCEHLESVIQECIEQSETKIILDCKHISFMDSKGLELLLRVNERLATHDGILKIIELSPVCHDIFVVTRLNNILNVYKDVREAMKSGP